MDNGSTSQMNSLSSFNVYSPSQPCTSSSGEFMSPAALQDDLYGTQPFHDARCSAFRPYTYVGDLMSLPPATPPAAFSMQPLWSFSELEERNRQLELENQRFREENEFLKEQLKLKSPTLDFDVTPRKVNFLKQLVNSLENCAPKKVATAKPTRLALFDELESTAQPELEPPCELPVDVDSANKVSWEESVTVILFSCIVVTI
ncbi:hypothetical protein ACJMK2_024832 [Sinanodonta woodiana]|uniref:Uncharacterized protein n=1 Tax=Sinanodonta woodiana TaxID=1069815 RepID=A0ABD3XF22_SINWO